MEVQSKPLFDNRQLLKLLVPLFIEQILSVTISFADSIMVASCGEAAVSAVSLVMQITILLNQLFAALATGGAVICAQYIGRRDDENARTTAKQLVWLCGAIGVAISATILLFHRQILSLIYGNIEAEVMDNCVKYFVIVGIGRPFIAVYNAAAALFRAVGNSGISMKVSLFMNSINLIGNAILIYGLDMGIVGAAIPTMFSFVVGAVVILAMLCKKNDSLYIEKWYKPIFRGDMIGRIVKIGLPNGLENSMFQLGKLLVASLITTFGTAAIAANAVANNVSLFAMIPGGAIGLGMVTVIGQCMGAGEVEQAVWYTKRLMKYMYIGIIGISVGIFALSPLLLKAFNLSQEAYDSALFIMRIYAFITAAFWAPAFGLANTFRAAGDARFTMIVSVFSMWAFRIGCSYLLALGFGLKLNGVWYAMYIDWVFRSVVFVIHFIRGKWKTIKVI